MEQEEAVTTVDEEITFEDLCSQLDEKIDDWREYYVLIDKYSETEITTTAVLDDTIENSKNKSKTNMTILCKPKFVFDVVDKTDCKENNFVLPYFRASTTTFATFFEKMTQNCSKRDKNHKIIHNLTGINNVIENDKSFNKMIDDCKYQKQTTIFITLKPQVWIFCYFFEICFV